MKTIQLVLILGVLFAFGMATPISAQTTYTSTASGNWSTMVWSPTGTPGTLDDVIIADGHSVRIDQNVAISNLTVGQGSSGMLSFDETTGRTVTISGNLTVNTGGSFQSYKIISITGDLTSGNTTISNVSSTAGIVTGMNITGPGLSGATVTSIGVPTPTDIVVSVAPAVTIPGAPLTLFPTIKDSLIIGGDLTNNGTFDMTVNTTTTVCNVTFNKLGNQALSGGGTTTRFSNITLAKTDTTQKVNSTANLTVAGNFLRYTGLRGGWAQSAGTLTITSNQVIAANNQIDIGSTGNMTVLGDMAFAGNLVVNTSGVLNFGLSSGENRFVQFQTLGCKGTFTAGTINVYGKWYMSTQNSTILWNGANINVDPRGNISGDYGFRVLNNVATFTWNAGTLTIMNPSNASGTQSEFNVAAGLKMTGTAKVVIGQGAGTNTVAYYGGIRLAGAGLPNVGDIEINSGNCPSLMSGSLTASGTLTLTSGVFNDSGYTVTAKGDVRNNATHVSMVLPAGRNGRIVMSSAGARKLYGNGTFGKLYFNDTLGTTIAGRPVINDTMRIIFGTVAVDTSTLTLNGSTIQGTATNLATISSSSLVFGGISAGIQLPSSVTNLKNLTINNPNGITLNSSPTIYGTLALTRGGITTGAFVINYDPASTLLYNGSTAQTTSDAEFPAVSGPPNLSISNAAGVALHASRAVGGTVTLTNGYLSTGANTLTALGSVTRTAGRVAGKLKKYVPTGTGVTQDFEIGDASNYSPVRITFGNVSALGALTVSTTAGSHPSLASSGLATTNKVNRYYTVTDSGTVFDNYAATLNFVNSDIDPGSLTSHFKVKKYDGGTWTSPTTENPLATSIDATGMTSFSDFAVGEELKYLTAGGLHGTVDLNPAGGVYAPRTSVVLTPTADPGYRFLNWTGNVPAGHETDNPLTVVMDSNKTLTAVFQKTYVITASAVHGSITPSGSVIVDEGRDTTFTFTPATGYQLDTLLVDGVKVDTATTHYTFTNVTASHTIAAINVIKKYALTINAEHGTVVKEPDQLLYEHGTSVNLSQTPDPAYSFVGWSGDVPIGHENDNPLTILMDGNKTVTANFTAIPTYDITASAVNGTIIPSGTVPVLEASNKTFTFAANTGYHLDSLVVDGVKNTDSTASYTFKNVTSPHSIHVYYSINTFTITSSAVNGTITPTPSVIVNYGSDQTFTFAPQTGYHLDSLFIDGLLNTDSTVSYTFKNVTASHSISVKYVINTYTITATAGSNGSISPPGVTTLNYGSSQAYTFTPAVGYHVDSFFVDGISQPVAAGYTFSNVTANHTISVKFAINTYTISATAGSNGTINPAGVTTVNYGGSQAYTFTPGVGYHVDSFFVDGISQPVASGYTFTNVTANHTISVKFAINTYTITASAGPNGTISPSGAIIVNYGSSQAFVFIPASGYHVDSVFIDGIAQPPSPGATFSNVTANHTVSVKFAINTFTLSLTAVHGSVLRDPSLARYDSGTTVQLTAVPDLNYHFVNWTGSVTSSDNPLSLVMNGNKTITANFEQSTYALTVNVTGNGTVTKNPDLAIYNSGSSVQLTAVPADLSWKFTGWSGDLAGTDNPATLLMNAVKNVTATFERDVAYLALYRTFQPDSLALDKDNLGKVGKYVQRKADKVFFKTALVSPLPAAALTLKLDFSMNAGNLLVYRGGVEPDTFYTMVGTGAGVKSISANLDTGTVFYVEGIGLKGKPMTIKFTWNTTPKATKGTVNSYFQNDLGMPMPNRVNALYETYLDGGFNSTLGLPVGLSRTDSTKYYAWIVAPKYSDVLKTLSDKTGRHNLENPRVLNYYDNTSLMKGQLKVLPPAKQNNGLVANLMTLKLNIAASALQKIPAGFGDLIYNGPPTAAESSAHFFLQGKTVSEIATIGDGIISGYYIYATHVGNVTALPILNDVIKKLNSAFEGPLDTLAFTSALRFKGTRALIDVPYLKASGSILPTLITPQASVISQEPESFALYQNYPNPFNPTTTISFDLPEQAFVTLKVYNMLGQEVMTLLENQLMDDGTQELQFNAGNLASGVYFYRIIAQGMDEDGVATTNFVTSKKMMLVR